MPSDQDHNMEKPLRTYARKRREDAGQPELHPATRQLLQAEAAKLRTQAGARGGLLWRLLLLHWPRVGFAAAVFVGLAVVVWNFLPGDNHSPNTMTMAKQFEKPLGDVAPTAGTALAPSDSGAMDGRVRKLEKKMDDTAELARNPVTEKEQQNDQMLRLRGLAEDSGLTVAQKPARTQAASDLDSKDGSGPALSARRAADRSLTLKTGTTSTTANMPVVGAQFESLSERTNDRYSYGLALDGVERRRYFDAGKGNTTTNGTGLVSLSQNGSSFADKNVSGLREDRFGVDPASGGRLANNFFSDYTLLSRATNAVVPAGGAQGVAVTSAFRAPAPVGNVAGVGGTTTSALGPLALNDQRLAETKAKAISGGGFGGGRTVVSAELAQNQPPALNRPESSFKEAKAGETEARHELLLAAKTSPRPTPVDALAPPASPVPVVLPATPAPSRTMTRAPAPQPAQTPAARRGGAGNNPGGSNRNDSNTTVHYRFARLSTENEVISGTRGAAAKAAPTTTPILARFDFEQDAGTVRLIDGDGSVYEGRIAAEGTVSADDFIADETRKRAADQPKDVLDLSDAVKQPGGPGRSSTWADRAATNASFRVSGTHRTSGQLVVFTGSLVSESSVTNGRQKFAVTLEPAQRLQRVGTVPTNAAASSRLWGRLRIGPTNESVFIATPAAK
jgi:hypothetical protein